MHVKKVFLSSTSVDLEEYREAVANAIDSLSGYQCIKMKLFTASDAAPAQLCRDKVSECELFVGILAFNYGSHPPDDQRSFTEIEFDASEGKPRLVFVASSKEGFRLDPAHLEKDEPREKQTAFRDRVGKLLTVKFFGTAEGLAREVIASIRNWETSQRTDGVQPQQQDSQVVDKARSEALEAHRHISMLAGHKDLHDQLHHLQKGCLDMLIQQSRNFPEGSDLETMRMYAEGLKDAIDKIRASATSSNLQAADEAWLQTLDQAHGLLNTAIDTGEKKPLDRSISLLRRVLARQPAIINERLKAAAASLRVAELTGKLIPIRDGKVRIDEAASKQLHSSLEKLEELGRRLPDLTFKHDEWQQRDQELMLIEANGLQDLADDWVDFKAKAEPLYGSNAGLVTAGQELDAALAGGDAIKVQNTFLKYRRLAHNAFFQVDSSLKALCKELQTVDELTSTILMMIK
jgi:Domain of unknown function (DUF4062)